MNWLKRLIAGKELQALERYRQASRLAREWNGMFPQSATTAEWISNAGEGRLAANTISDFREALKENKGKEYLQQQYEHLEYMEKEFQRTIKSVAR